MNKIKKGTLQSLEKEQELYLQNKKFSEEEIPLVKEVARLCYNRLKLKNRLR